MIAFHERRHDAVLGGNGEPRDHPEREREPEQHPHLHRTGQDDHGHCSSQQATGDVGDHHHANVAANRSVTAPPTNMNAARGRPSRANTMPSTRGSLVNWRASHGVAMRAN